MLINGDPVSTVVLSDAYGAFAIPLTEVGEGVSRDWVIGAGEAGINKFTGDLAEVWLDASTALDLSDPDNAELFWQNGTARSFGIDGSSPLGSQPLIYLHLDDGAPAVNFATNRGSGGAMTVVGTLVTASEVPTPGEVSNVYRLIQSLDAQQIFDGVISQQLGSVTQGLIATGLDFDLIGVVDQVVPAVTQAVQMTETIHHIGVINQTTPAARNRSAWYDFLSSGFSSFSRRRRRL